MLHHALIKIFSSQVCVPLAAKNVKDALVDIQQGHVEGTTTQVEHKNVLILDGPVLIKSVCNRSCSWLVDDPLYGQSGNAS
mmetsp:Transcript_19223/g.53565  ORF Transcript_19223/g.53565 Transcript_19223/m.53565 type:complete len:81 (-) Transcript_19223:696-938(-)